MLDRVRSESIENLLGKEIKVLDKGFVRVIDYMGDDTSIVQAARVSYGKGTKQLNNDIGLIRYLLKHKHTTPFEMCDIKFHIKAPIFIARQWMRHRTASINEYSARYSILDEEYYIPSKEQIKPQSVSNKQGRNGEFSQERVSDITGNLTESSRESFETYTGLIEEDEDGKSLAKELARIVLPVNVYTQFYWKLNLHNLLHFLRLRADAHAQYEIRVYAEAILDIVKNWVPITHEAFMDYAVNAKTFSAEELLVIKRLLKGDKVVREDTKLSKREWSELHSILELSSS